MPEMPDGPAACVMIEARGGLFLEQIGRFRILGELGRGAMGVVYKAHDPTIGRVVAIKSIRLDELTDDADRARLKDRLLREARSAGMLSHPGIVTIYDTLEEDGKAYIFMEWVNGPTLEKMLNQGPIEGSILLGLLHQTAEALDYAHDQGIVHRDIKPGNVMINEAGRAKIADFGVARIMSQELTLVGTLLGTPSYMAPEQVQGLPADGRADQFALAVIAYEALTGEKPFAADHIAALLYRITREEPTPASRLNGSLRAPVDAALRRALSKDPAARFETCREFAEVLTAACALSPGWATLPRGATSNLPTVFIEPVLTDSAAAKADPLPEWSRGPLPVNHRGRKLWAALGAVLLVGATFLLWPKPKLEVLETPITIAEPVVEAVNPPAEAQPAAVVPQTAVPVQAPQPITVQVVTKPAGARVVFDGSPEKLCESPCSMTILSGKHTLLVTRAGYRDVQRMIEVPPETEISADLVLITGTLSMVTTPAGLPVLIDGQEQSRKTPFSIALPVGEHRIQVVNGAQRQEFTVQIPDGGIISKVVEWQ